MAVLAAAGGRGAGLEQPAGMTRAVGGLERDRVVAEGRGGAAGRGVGVPKLSAEAAAVLETVHAAGTEQPGKS